MRDELAESGVTEWCLEPHDLALAKLAAHRAKDKAFVGALIDAGILQIEILDGRVESLQASPAEITAVKREYSGWRR